MAIEDLAPRLARQSFFIYIYIYIYTGSGSYKDWIYGPLFTDQVIWHASRLHFLMNFGGDVLHDVYNISTKFYKKIQPESGLTIRLKNIGPKIDI